MNGVIGYKGSRLESKIANLAICFVTLIAVHPDADSTAFTQGFLSDELGWGGAHRIPALSFEQTCTSAVLDVFDTMARMMLMACFGYDDTSNPILILCRVGG